VALWSIINETKDKQEQNELSSIILKKKFFTSLVLFLQYAVMGNRKLYFGYARLMCTKVEAKCLGKLMFLNKSLNKPKIIRLDKKK
jgi:hypothetical protein